MEQKVKTGLRMRWWKILIIMAAVLLVLFGGAGILFLDELKIVSSIKKVDAAVPMYEMKVEGDYYFQEFLDSGGASSDQEVSGFLTEKISKGFYAVTVENNGSACSTLSTRGLDGAHVWGRNYDWDGSVPIVVKSVPTEGYASVSTCDFQNVTGSTEVVPDTFMNKMLAIAALYVPLDGVNSAGLCVADLQVNEGGMPEVDTEKPDLTVTTAIRLLLNRAATVEEAVALLQQYDIHSSGGISHHLSIADATGASVAVEFTQEGIVVVDTNVVTNFNLAVGDKAAGGFSAQYRFETLSAFYGMHRGILAPEDMKDALSQAAQTEEKMKTQWSIVYEDRTDTVYYYMQGDYTTAFGYSAEP